MARLPIGDERMVPLVAMVPLEVKNRLANVAVQRRVSLASVLRDILGGWTASSVWACQHAELKYGHCDEAGCKNWLAICPRHSPAGKFTGTCSRL